MEALILGNLATVAGQGLPWAIAVIAIGALYFTDRKAKADLKECQEARIADGSKIASIAEKSTMTSATLLASMEARSKLIEDMGRSLIEIAKQVDANDDRLRDRLDRFGADARELAQELRNRRGA